MRPDEKPYRILVIEDNPGDFVIVEDLLTEQISMPVITHTTNYHEAVDIFATGKIFDIILLDLSLPDKSGQELITSILQIASAPVIILTGYTDVDFSIKSVSGGISDYLLKDDLDAAMLYKSIIYAIERKKAVNELARSQKQYSDLFNLSPQPMWVYELETFRFVQINKATTVHYGYSAEEFLNMTLMDIKLVEDIPALLASVKNQVPARGMYPTTTRHLKKSGEVIEVEIYTTPIIINDKACRSVIAIDVTEKKKFEDKITKAIIKTQEDERYEIGGELHDNVCQILAASQLCLGMLTNSEPKDEVQLLNLCKENIKLAIDETRNLSHRLAPAIFDDTNLEEAFQRLFNNFNIEKKLKLKLYFDEAVTNYPLNREVQLNLYRILQEQFRNIIKYANAKIIEVHVYISNHKLKMQITDDGIGFDMDTVKKGIGLANMKRRAELFAGKFEINTSPGNGCAIKINIPLANTNLPIPQGS